MPMFIAALFTVAMAWKQAKCPLREDWIMMIWHIHTVEHYSAMRKDEILPSVTTWMDLENIILRKVSPSEKAKSHMISLICGTEK